jgi:hypothetical protein
MWFLAPGTYTIRNLYRSVSPLCFVGYILQRFVPKQFQQGFVVHGDYEVTAGLVLGIHHSKCLALDRGISGCVKREPTSVTF